MRRSQAVDPTRRGGVHHRFRLDRFFIRPVGPIREKGLDLGGIFSESNLVVGRVPTDESTVAVRRDLQIDPSGVVRKNLKAERCCVLRAQLLQEMKRPAWQNVKIVRVNGI